MLLLSRSIGLQHHLVARSGDVNGDALAAQLPSELVSGGYVLLGGVFREVDRLAQAVVDEGLHGGLHAHVLLGGDVA